MEPSSSLIDGTAIAKRLLAEVAAHVQDLAEKQELVPGLAVVLVGDDPASRAYVAKKTKACEETGVRSYATVLPATTGEDELLDLIAEMNGNPQVNGILVQLPLPAHIDAKKIINAVDPIKDVDGFHPVNVGRAVSGLFGLRPCTPTGCMLLIESVTSDLRGLRALVLGRSAIVGKPMADMLLQADCTVTIAHSRTKDIAQECRQADILVAAVGKPLFVQGDWIKKGAIVIDVGINRIADPATGKTKLVGDVDFNKALCRARAITPVPGGVGPMTIACLMMNTLKATMLQNGWG